MCVSASFLVHLMKWCSGDKGWPTWPNYTIWSDTWRVYNVCSIVLHCRAWTQRLLVVFDRTHLLILGSRPTGSRAADNRPRGPAGRRASQSTGLRPNHTAICVHAHCSFVLKSCFAFTVLQAIIHPIVILDHDGHVLPCSSTFTIKCYVILETHTNVNHMLQEGGRHDQKSHQTQELSVTVDRSHEKQLAILLSLLVLRVKVPCMCWCLYKRKGKLANHFLY